LPEILPPLLRLSPRFVAPPLGARFFGLFRAGRFLCPPGI
jgi:hypothetical protein